MTGRIALKMRATRGRSRSRSEPALPATTLGTGQPMLRSITAAPRSWSRIAEAASAWGSPPKSCTATSGSPGSQSSMLEERRSPRVIPSDETIWLKVNAAPIWRQSSRNG